MSKKKALYVAMIVSLIVSIFGGTAFAEADRVPGGPSTEGNTNISSIITYDEMIKELNKLEKRSKGSLEIMTLDEFGYEPGKSEAGRDLYVAKIGEGDEKVWVQGRIHGNEPYGTESILEVMKKLVSNGSPTYETLREEITFYFIPMYNPDGSEKNIRHTLLEESEDRRIDLNRDWAEDGFAASESLAYYSFWTDVKPDYAIDIHHQGLKTQYGTNKAVTLSLGISLAPGGPTLPSIEDGAYDELTRQMQVYVYDALNDYGNINIDRYTVGGGDYVIDIKGGVVSAMMLGLNYDGMNADGHSNPAVFFETSGNTRDGNLGQKSRGKLIRQNVRGLESLLYGIATEEVKDVDAERWDEIPISPIKGYQTDDGIIPIDNEGF
ncbi:M14 family zinc carboxypeptidase [Alteribacillus iranensis]|uniref:Zinc carboxypeptidase n=1 Tax=Alteribacillus iranensis TaxID=930128 RepID=A0A1I2B8Q7_9BACI|nr:M14 family zinc carboxypeptidase [Alteribacillus iranensis]SFE52456.1 Zinc carboxypeptidase [Alteribacillus iranensis]